MEKVLVFGNGYLGGHLVGQLRAKGHRVEVASKNGTRECREADLGLRASLNSLASELRGEGFTPTRIVHCASSGRGGPGAYREVFVEGIRNLIAIFPNTAKILTSSTSVYPQIDGGIVTEESPANPDRETGKCLREAEDLLVKDGGIALRLAGIYGPGRSVHLQKMLDGSATIESGEVSRWLNQIHRDDAAKAILHFIELKEDRFWGQRYNVTDDCPLTQRRCYETLSEMLGKPIPRESPPDRNRKRAWTNKKVSNEKLKATGWRPDFPSFVSAVKDDSRLLDSVREILPDQGHCELR